MFKLTRRTLAGLTAVAALAAGIGTAATTPEAAEAAPVCKQWKFPKSFTISQTNGWDILSSTRTATWTWKVYGTADPDRDEWSRGTMKVSRFDTSGSYGVYAKVRFTIVWANGTGGVYTAYIDDDGFLSGNATDRFNSRSKARFHFEDTIPCHR